MDASLNLADEEMLGKAGQHHQGHSVGDERLRDGDE